MTTTATATTPRICPRSSPHAPHDWPSMVADEDWHCPGVGEQELDHATWCVGDDRIGSCLSAGTAVAEGFNKLSVKAVQMLEPDTMAEPEYLLDVSGADLSCGDVVLTRAEVFGLVRALLAEVEGTVQQ